MRSTSGVAVRYRCHGRERSDAKFAGHDPFQFGKIRFRFPQRRDDPFGMPSQLLACGSQFRSTSPALYQWDASLVFQLCDLL
jgi:hypothetical protein